MNEKTWHEVSWESFIAEFAPAKEEMYLVVTRSIFENIYAISATSAADAASKIDEYDFYQKHIGEDATRIANTPLSEDEIHDTLTNNGYF